jgi:hypothetical protein
MDSNIFRANQRDELKKVEVLAECREHVHGSPDGEEMQQGEVADRRELVTHT